MSGRGTRLPALGMILVGAAASAACSPPRVQRAPADRVMSIGVVDGNPGLPITGGQPANGGPPQAASKVNLKFTGGSPGPFTVVASRVSTPPTVDGDASDPCWADIAGSNVLLVPPGEAIGMTDDELGAEFLAAMGYLQVRDHGTRDVRAKVAFDDQTIYLLLQWADPTLGAAREDWVAQGGVFARTRRDEDRVYLSFDIGDSTPAYRSSGCAAACHVNERLGSTSPTDVAYRFKMHTGGPGQRLDAWVWRAGRTDPLEIAEDGYLDEITARFDCDDPPACATTCANGEAPPCSAAPYADNSDGAVQPAPLYMGAQGVDMDPLQLFLVGSDPSGLLGERGSSAAVPFSPASVPLDGSTIPGAALKLPSARRMDVKAKGRWVNGIWTLELSRPLVTGDPDDAQFPLQ